MAGGDRADHHEPAADDDDVQEHRGHDAPLTEVELRVRTLESLLVDKGLVDPAALDLLIDRYETKIGPRNGARIVARAWVDPAFRRTAPRQRRRRAIGRARDRRPARSEQLVAVENTPTVHNVVVCTLCSCYPSSFIGLPPFVVQEPLVPLARRPASRGRSCGKWVSTFKNSVEVTCLGLECRTTLHGAAGAASRNRWLDRRAADASG